MCCRSTSCEAIGHDAAGGTEGPPEPLHQRLRKRRLVEPSEPVAVAHEATTNRAVHELRQEAEQFVHLLGRVRLIDNRARVSQLRWDIGWQAAATVSAALGNVHSLL